MWQTLIEAKAAAGITATTFAMPLLLALLTQTVVPGPSITVEEVSPQRQVSLALRATPALPEPEPQPQPQPQAEVTGLAATAPTSPRTPPQPTAGVPAGEPRTRIDSARPAPRPPEDATPKKKRKRRRNCEEDSPSIAEAGEQRWLVERAMVQYYVRHLSELNGLGYVAQHDGPDGKPDGLRVGGLRCNNVVVQAGIKNGDVIHTVNGKPVRSLLQAIWVYQSLRRKDDLTVTITRRGRRINLRYRIT